MSFLADPAGATLFSFSFEAELRNRSCIKGLVLASKNYMFKLLHKSYHELVFVKIKAKFIGFEIKYFNLTHDFSFYSF